MPETKERMSTNLHNKDTTLSKWSYYTSKFVSWWYRAYNSRPEHKQYHHIYPNVTQEFLPNSSAVKLRVALWLCINLHTFSTRIFLRTELWGEGSSCMQVSTECWKPFNRSYKKVSTPGLHKWYNKYSKTKPFLIPTLGTFYATRGPALTGYTRNKPTTSTDWHVYNYTSRNTFQALTVECRQYLRISMMSVPGA